MKTSLFKIFFIIILFTIELNSIAQISKSNKNLFKQAVILFNNEDYFSALPLFLDFNKLYPNDFETNYYIAACYLNTPYQKTLAIPYLEFSVKNDKNILPPTIYKDMGLIYQLDYKFDSAITNYNKYLKQSYNDDVFIQEVKQNIENCNYAKYAIKDSINIEIEALPKEINDNNSCGFPFITTDNEFIFFTKTFRKNIGVISVDSVSKVLYSKKINNKWQQAKEIIIDKKNNYNNIFLVGISPQGGELFFRIDIDSTNSDLFICKLDGDSCTELKPFNSIINSKFKESMCSITADGKDFYFTSNRPGGYGGFDIYRVTQNENNEWCNPINIGPEINTIFDEDGPFIHPDKQTLYFSSKGHSGFGGFDFFVSQFQFFQNAWEIPSNLGFPLNTTYNDVGIYLTADASNAYFSSSNNNKNQKFDIYKANFIKSIPLTLVKGVISNEENKPIKAQIKVVEHETKEIIKYIYNPNPKTGKYLMIFPPGKNYDMIIEAEGYIPHIVNIFIPDQTYFYSLYQEIHLEKLELNEFGQQIGEKITVENTFFDIYNTQNTSNSDTTIINNNVPSKTNYSNLLEIIEKLISKTDSIGVLKLDSITNYETENKENSARDKNYNELLNLVENAIETTDSISLDILNKNVIYNDTYVKSYFFNYENKLDELIYFIIGNDTIRAFPPLNTETSNIQNNSSIVNNLEQSTNNIEKVDNQFDISKCSIDNRKYIFKYSIYFANNSSNVKTKYIHKLNEISNLLINNPDLGIEINGYADAKGKESQNLILSNLRAREVMQLLLIGNLKIQRIILEGYGETKAINFDDENDRRVDVNVFQVKDINNLDILEKESETEINKIYPINNNIIPTDKIEYRIQIASCKKEISLTDINFKKLHAKKYNYGNRINYTYGSFDNKEKATEELNKIIEMGFKDAFLVKFIDNKRINWDI